MILAATHEPRPKRSGGRPLAAMRWELGKAAIEFGTDPRPLLKKLETARQHPDGRGRYTTRQLLDAVFDEQYRMRTEKLRSEADKLRLSNETRRRELIPASEVKEFCRALAVGLRPVIMGLAAPDSDKQKVFSLLAELENGALLAKLTRPRRTRTV